MQDILACTLLAGASRAADQALLRAFLADTTVIHITVGALHNIVTIAALSYATIVKKLVLPFASITAVRSINADVALLGTCSADAFISNQPSLACLHAPEVGVQVKVIDAGSAVGGGD